MNTAPFRNYRRGLILASALIAFLAAGCSSDQPGRQPEGRSHPRPHTPPLAGHGTFFNGQITAELTVGRGPGFSGKPGAEGDEISRPETRRPGGGGGFRMGGGAGGGRPHGEGGPMGGGEGGRPDPVESQQMSAMRHAANPNPPVMIHLRFTNHGPAHAELLVADFLSPLGNFVVEPEKLQLDPGQTVEVEPMTSRLVGEISSVTVTLALRLAGQGEKKNIVLTVMPEAAPSAPPAEKPTEAK